jgi:hypothetical protein
MEGQAPQATNVDATATNVLGNVSSNVRTTNHLELFVVEKRLDRRVDYKDIDALENEIATHNGLVNPIKVFLHPEKSATGLPQLVLEDGMRRLRAITNLKAKGISVPVRYEVVETGLEAGASYDEIVDLKLGMLLMYNSGEKFTPMEEVGIYQEYITSGKTVAEVARIVGKSVQHIGHMMPLLSLSPEAKDLIDGKAISPSLAASVIQRSDTIEEANSTIAAAAANALAQGQTSINRDHLPEKIVDKKVSLSRLQVFRDYFTNAPELYAVLNAAAQYTENVLSLDDAINQSKSVFPEAIIVMSEELRLKTEAEAAAKLAKEEADAEAKRLKEEAKLKAAQEKAAEKEKKDKEKAEAKAKKELEAAEKKAKKEEAAKNALSAAAELASVAPMSKEAIFGKKPAAKAAEIPSDIDSQLDAFSV